MSDEISNRVGDYEILEFIGAGGMGKVFKVRNVISDRVEAMKVLLPELTAQEDLIKRFLHEIKMLATLEHPNIASLHTALTIQGQFVMVMEYVEGTTIAKLMESGPIPVGKAINYTEQVLSALSYAHSKGIIHRDIKPANMMLTPDGTIKLMDFGIARSKGETSMTMVGTTLGSLYYMSPEQVKGEPIDGRSDLYALGISLYEMVTGHKPFETGTDYSIMAAHLKEPPKPPIEIRPDLPAALNEIILMAVAKDPAARFQTPDAMRRALGNLSGSASYETKQPMAVPGASAPAGAGTAAFAAAPVPMPTSVPSMPAMAASAPTPQPAPTSGYVPMPQAPRSGHRGLYMTLGAVIVLIGLVAAGLYLPKLYKTHAGEDKAATPISQPASTPAATPATTPDNSAAAPAPAPDTTSAAPPADETAQPAAPTPTETPAVAKKGTRGNVGAGSAADYGAAQRAAQEAAQRAADERALRQVEEETRLLTTRMASVDSSIATMRHQQEQAGYGLRGDIASTQDRLHMNMNRLDAAIRNQDLKSARHLQELCDRDAATLESFLGR
ncbi:MAG TPA: serine/threonine-protein kinase [Candidatus Koribacter sp.]|jgi:serine/threonine-protein kinase